MRAEGAPEQDSGTGRSLASIRDLNAIDLRPSTRGVRMTLWVRPFSDLIYSLNPGLKPWAILFSHFVATAVSPIRRFARSAIAAIHRVGPYRCLDVISDRFLRRKMRTRRLFRGGRR